MPKRPKRPCRYPGCPNLCKSGTYCPEHSAESPDRLRGSAAERGYEPNGAGQGSASCSAIPCAQTACRKGVLTPATVVDHIVPHRGDHRLFWDEQNWQPLCKACHDRKTGSGL